MSLDASSGFVRVSQDQFYAYMGPRDIVLRTEPSVTYWETRNRQIVGYSTPGYKGGAVKTYFLAPNASSVPVVRA